MPEVAPALRHRWFRIRWVGEREAGYAWAEKFFDNRAEAFDYHEQRLAGHPTGRVHPPLASHEDAAVWAVCVDPV